MKLNIKVNNQNYEVEIKDLNARPVIAVVGGETFEVWPEKETHSPVVETPAVVPVAPAPPPAPSTKPAVTGGVDKNKVVVAPIPGVIVTINVKEGEGVAAGKEVCVLEAMKMKNSIRTARAGTIAVIRVSVGELVKNGQVLMEFSD